MNIGYELNYQHAYLIDVNPTGDPEWAYLGPGISEVSDDGEDTTVSKNYYSNGGVESTQVTAVNTSFAIKGDRLHGDKAQDYIVSKKYCAGNDRRTHLRQVNPDGEVVQWDGILTGIKGGSATGAAADNTAFECEFKAEGYPVIIEDGEASALPEEITVADISVAVGAKTNINPTVTPSDASGFCGYAVADNGVDICSVDALGNVKGLKAGETTIAVKCMAKPSVSAVVKVTVASS